METLSIIALESLNGGGSSDTPQQLFDKIKDLSGTFTNKTIDADDNTISDLTVGNIKSGKITTGALADNDIFATKGYVDDNTIVSVLSLPAANSDSLGHRVLYDGRQYRCLTDGSIYFWSEVANGIVVAVDNLPSDNIVDTAVYCLDEMVFVYDGTSYGNLNIIAYKREGDVLTIDENGITEDETLTAWESVDTALIESYVSSNWLSEITTPPREWTDAIRGSVEIIAPSDGSFYAWANSWSILRTFSYYAHNEEGWRGLSAGIDGHYLNDSSTRRDVRLVGVDDIQANGTPSTEEGSITINLEEGSEPSPDIIQDGAEYRYSTERTSSNNYINTQLDSIKSMAEGSNKSYFIDYPNALPSAGNRNLNSYYYVQQDSAASTNYKRWFIDSTDTARDLGTTQINISTLVPKTDVVAPNASSTEGQVADAKAVYDNYAPINGSYAHANNAESVSVDDGVFDFHYQTSNNRASEIKLYSNARMIHPISRSGNIYGSLRTTQTLKTSNTVVFIQEFTESINGETRGLLSFKRVGVLGSAGWNLVVSNKENIVWQDWQPVNYNYTKKGYSSAFSLDNCLWDVAVDGTDSIISEKRMLTNVSFTCPVANTTKYYRVETSIDTSGAAVSGRASVITQIATRITNAGVTSPEVVKRIGLLSYHATNAPDASKVYTYRSQIVWKSWFPVEYPATNFTLDSTKATTTTCSYMVSGGNLFIRMTGLLFTTSSTNETIGNLPTGLGSAIKGGNSVLVGYESSGTVRTMYIERTNGDIKANVSTGGSQIANPLQVYTSVPLGY